MPGLLRQLQVVNALLLREVKTRFGDHQLGYVWALIEPMLFIAIFAGAFFLLGRRPPPPGIGVMPFLVAGFVPFLMYRHTSQQALAAISGNKGLLLYPQVRPLDLVMARVLLEISTGLVVFVLLMSGVALFEMKLRINDVLLTLGGLACAAGLGGAVGLVLCGLSTFSPTVERVHGPLFRPLLWISAVFHPFDSLPTAVREVLVFNPLVHCIELVRLGWFPGYQSRHIDPTYPVAWILVLTFFGLSLERVARRRLELS